ncbi:MAG: hypothetical protein ACM30I_16415 [Gemmatimonas sp.]
MDACTHPSKTVDADELISYWAALGDRKVHPHDRDVVGEGHFATELVPVPWVGPIRTARVYLLFLNPGLSPHDHGYERDNAEFVAALRSNLTGGVPYVYLQNRFCDHPGYAWASCTFGDDIREEHTGDMCVIQLVPYHSKEGAVARRAARRLPSSRIAGAFVRDTLIPRAAHGEIGLIVARSARLWGFGDAAHDDSGNIVVYRGAECRRAFQTEKTRGGRLLRRMLGIAAQQPELT